MNTPPPLATLWEPPANALENPAAVRRWLERVERVRSAYPNHTGVQLQADACERLGAEYLRAGSAQAELVNTPPADAA